MTWEAAPTGKPDRQPEYSDAAIQTCLTMKVLFGMVDIVAPLVRATMSTRQATGFVESLLCLIGLNRDVPDFNTLSRRQKTLRVNIPYRGSQGPLHLLIDIEPVSATGSSEPARDAAGTSGPDPARSADRQRHRRWCLRIHGTNKPRTIGTAVSNGCARLINDHAIDLYDRVKIGTAVYLHTQAAV